MLVAVGVIVCVVGVEQRQVVAVLNGATFVSGSYPTLGPQLLSDAGVLLLEAAPDSPLRRGIADRVCAPVQRLSRSSVFSSTAKRRLKG